MHKGKHLPNFFAFEGKEAAGKTTQIDLLKIVLDFHEKVRRGYLAELASFLLGFIERINGEGSVEEIAKMLTKKVLAEIVRQKPATT